jgi:signal transduction histidine kinase
MIPWQNRLPKGTRPFLQPMTLILVCLVFISLILFTGLMDIGRLEQTLRLFMENHGLDISARIQRDTQENFSNINQVLRGDHLGDTLSPFMEEAFLPQESFIDALVRLTRRIDKSLDSGAVEPDAFKRMAADNHLSLLALLDEKGHPRLQTRPFSKTLLRRAEAVIKGKKETSIDIFNRYGDHEKLGSIALRRGTGSEILLAAWDDPGLRYWGFKVALQKALEEAGRSEKLPYIAVMDAVDGSLVASLGDVPGDVAKEEGAFQDILSGKASVSSRKVTLQGKNLFEILAPLYLDSKLAGIVRVGLQRDQADQVIGKNRTLMIISMVFIMLIGLLSIWFLYQNQNRHLARIEEMRKELQKSERLSSLGQLAAGVAHEIRNPLNAISMASQRLQREFLPSDEGKMEEFGQITGVIRDEVRRLNGIIEEFLSFSRSQRLELREYSLQAVLQKLVHLVGEEAAARGITIETRWGDQPTSIPMDVDKLQQAFLNFIKNAMESISGEGLIAVSIEQPGNENISVKITDTGKGLTPDEIDRIFNPEYTTKEKGLGLGLPIAYEIVRGHGGDIRVKSMVGAGTTFEILLPLGR